MTWEQLRVGLLILGGLAIGALGIFLVGRTGNVFGDRYDIVTLVRSAAGLVPGAAVQLAGQTVGQVERIELIPAEDRPESGEAVALWLNINTDVQQQIRSDSRAQVRTQGLLGDKLIDISPGGVDGVVLTEGDTLEASNAVDFDQLISDGAGAIDDLVGITRDLSDLTRGVLEGEGTLGSLVVDARLYEEITGLAASLDTLFSAVARPDGTVMRMLEDDELYAALRRTVASLDSASAKVARGEGSIGQLIGSDSLYVALLSTVNRTDSLLARLEAGEGSLGKMMEDPRLYEELLQTVVDLGALLDAFREDPERYVPDVSVF